MTVRELLEYLLQADSEATIYIETETERVEAVSIIEDRQGLYISSA